MSIGAPTPTGDLPHESVAFAHPSERDFARVLDFYGVEWRYEPRTFVLSENADGHPTEAFSPDFYLPDLDLYIELTTLKQRLVTKKNRKIRELRQGFYRQLAAILIKNAERVHHVAHHLATHGHKGFHRSVSKTDVVAIL